MKSHPKIEKVYFPLDEGFPQYQLAKKQMNGACGLLTVQLKTDSFQQIEQFVQSLKHFLLAVSWGGHESLVMPKAASLKSDDFNKNDAEHRFLRFYIGLEDANLLITDLENGLINL